MTKQNVLLTSYPQEHRGVMQADNIQILFCLIPHNAPTPSPPPLLPLFFPLSLIPSLLAFQTGTMLIKVARSVDMRGEWD